MISVREIGGYLELERFGGEPYHKDAIALNCGRACLEYLIELRSIRTIWLPDWMCDAVYNVCAKCGVEVRVYNIGPDMLPAYDFEVGDGEYLYLMDYYGQLCPADVDEALRRSGGRLVVDEAQGFFRMPWDGADTLYTCRKYFGVADGGYLYTKDGSILGRELKRDESHARMGFVLGRFERPASEFFAEASTNNDVFNGVPMRAMSPITENLMRVINYEGARRRREENWSYLHKRLGEENLLDLHLPEGPFMYPLMMQNTDSIRQRLVQEKIFVPMLWPNVSREQPHASWASCFSREILPLPIDQRYEKNEMRRLADTVEAVLKGACEMPRELQGKRLLVLGAYETEREIVAAARHLGAYTAVTDYHLDWRDAPAKFDADEAWDISWSDFDALAKRCHVARIDGVMAGFSERRVACAQELSRRLGTPFYADGSDLGVILHKTRFKEACRIAGVDVARSFDADSAEVPVIVKPADNGGSRGITVCHRKEDIGEAIAKAVGSSDSGSVEIEEYIVADEVMVYYVVHNGKAMLSAMCDRYMRSFDPSITQLPVGYLFPSKHLGMFEDEHDGSFRRLISSLGIENGLIAFQCFVKDRRVIPFDPTFRLDGTMAYRATEAANGSNALEMLVRYSLTGTMGDGPSIEAAESPWFRQCYFELPILLGPGTISSIVGLDVAEEMDGVYFVERKAAVGDVFHRKADFSQMLCRIQLVADGVDHLRERLRGILRAVDAFDEHGESMVLYRDADALASGKVERCGWR